PYIGPWHSRPRRRADTSCASRLYLCVPHRPSRTSGRDNIAPRRCRVPPPGGATAAPRDSRQRRTRRRRWRWDWDWGRRRCRAGWRRRRRRHPQPARRKRAAARIPPSTLAHVKLACVLRKLFRRRALRRRAIASAEFRQALADTLLQPVRRRIIISTLPKFYRKVVFAGGKGVRLVVRVAVSVAVAEPF